MPKDINVEEASCRELFIWLREECLELVTEMDNKLGRTPTVWRERVFDEFLDIVGFLPHLEDRFGPEFEHAIKAWCIKQQARGRSTAMMEMTFAATLGRSATE